MLDQTKKKQNLYQYWIMVLNNLPKIKKHNPILAKYLEQKLKEGGYHNEN